MITASVMKELKQSAETQKKSEELDIMYQNAIIYLYFLIYQNLLISGEKMSAEFKGCVA